MLPRPSPRWRADHSNCCFPDRPVPAPARHPCGARTAGGNRIQLVVDDLRAEIDRLRAAGLSFSSEEISGPGGSQILLADPSGNLVELFQPAAR